VISPCIIENELAGFVANRAHHADIGADSPGSMPLSRSLAEEGLLISPVHLYKEGALQAEVWRRLLQSLRNPQDGAGDFNAQVGANRRGRSGCDSWSKAWERMRIARVCGKSMLTPPGWRTRRWR
jgi:N-methylhydantoinase B